VAKLGVVPASRAAVANPMMCWNFITDLLVDRGMDVTIFAFS